MKKHILAAAMLSIWTLAAEAQTGIIGTKPANTDSDKLLTMEEAVLGRNLYPERFHDRWAPEGGLLTKLSGNGLSLYNPLDGTEKTVLTLDDIKKTTGYQNISRYKWLSGSEAVFSDGRSIITIDINTKKANSIITLPENCSNLTLNPAGYHPYTLDNGLWFCDSNGNSYPIATSEDKNIIYGQTVSRNEFGIGGGIFLSRSGKKTAFYRKDETAVGTFPLLDIESRTGELRLLKYPMAGMASENIQLGIYDFASNKTVYVQADDFGYDQYLTGVTWSPDDRYILIQVLDRSQKNMRLNVYDTSDGSFVKTVLTEYNKKYVEPQDPVWFIQGSNESFIYRTDNRDGYKNLYLCSLSSDDVRRLTKTDADITYIGNDGKKLFYTSAEISPVENHLFCMDIKSGKIQRLTLESGWHEVSVSPDGKYFIDSWSNLTTPSVAMLKSTDGKKSHTLLNAPDPTADFAFGEISLGTVKSADGRYDNFYRLIKPKDFDPTKKYPVILYVYGGPHSQMVRNTWLAELRRWEMLMAQKGYIVYVQDNRGTLNHGAEFEKAIHGQCGQAEMADQMEGIKMLTSLPYVDKDRIGVHGWSYGGFMTISLITNYPEIFKVAVAGGPVIDWKWYEIMYGERYMDNPATNSEGYSKVSLINQARNLKGKLLICQGAVDNVVVWEHSLSFIRECIKNNVQVDYFPYPCAEHNVMGKDRIHLMDKVTNYFEDYL